MREPHRAHVVALVMDMTGFAAFADSTDPEVLFEKLQEYHRTMGAIIDEHHGTVIDYFGDGMLVVFNDPESLPEPEREAFSAAFKFRESFAQLAQRWAREGYRLGIRIGVDAGFATLGRIGYDRHHAYGVVGRVVNNATLISQRGAAEGKIVASQRSVAPLEQQLTLGAVVDLALKDRVTPVKVVEVMGWRFE